MKISPEPNCGCWLWTGAINPEGYGRIRVGNKTMQAHRYSYEKAKGSMCKIARR